MNRTREEVLFTMALEQPIGQRGAFLESVCPDDPALRRRVEALLAAHEGPDPRLANPVTILLPRSNPNSPTVESTERPNEMVGQTIGRYKLLEKIGKTHGKTAAQVCLRWLVQQGIIVIPRTSRVERLEENFALLDFELSDAEMREIAGLARSGSRIVDWTWSPNWD